jgi:hypothetical protein
VNLKPERAIENDQQDDDADDADGAEQILQMLYNMVREALYIPDHHLHDPRQ